MKTSLSLLTTADLKNLAKIHDFVDETSRTFGVEPETILRIQLAVDEAVTNIIVHGYRGLGGSIEIELSRRADELVIRIRDEAAPFDPTRFPPPDMTLPLEKRKPGGLGIHLMRQVTDEMSHRRRATGGNELIFVKRGISKR